MILGKDYVVLGLLMIKKGFATFTPLRVVADNLANGKRTQIGYLDMLVTSVGQPKQVPIVPALR